MERTRDLISVLAAVVVLGLSLALAAWILLEEGAPVSRVATSGNPVAPGASPSPSPGPATLALAKRSRDVLFGLLVRPGGPIDVVVRTIEEAPLSPSFFQARLAGAPEPAASPRSCGRGCFRLSAPALAGRPLRLTLAVRRPSRPVAQVTFRLPAELPPSGAALLDRVEKAMGSLRFVRVLETLGNGDGFVTRARFEMQAPDRIRFETSHGQRTVLIGNRRWDWKGGRWVAAPFPDTKAPVYAWEGATHARLLGKALVAGTRVEVLALYLPGDFPAWFRLYVTPEGRVLRSQMLAQSHFMTHRFYGFDEPLRIEAPA